MVGDRNSEESGLTLTTTVTRGFEFELTGPGIFGTYWYEGDTRPDSGL